jgi:hypothetical protein
MYLYYENDHLCKFMWVFVDKKEENILRLNAELNLKQII